MITIDYICDNFIWASFKAATHASTSLEYN